MATISAVAPGARLRRRKNSTRGLSSAFCSLASVKSVWIVEMRLCGARDTPRVRPHFSGQKREETQPFRRIEPRVAVEQLAGDGDAGGFPATRDQRTRQLLDVISRVGAEQRLGQ